MGITVNIQRGGLGRQSANSDKWGGLYVEVDILPANWTQNEVKRIFKVEDLEAYGIKEDAATDYFKLVYWHASEVFRLEKNATLYVCLGTVTTTVDYDAIVTAFKDFQENLRLITIVSYTATLNDAEVNLFQTALDDVFSEFAMPCRGVLTVSGASVPDLSAESNYRVMVDVANDITANGLAKSVFDSIGMCGAGGTILGQLLLLSAHHSPAWRMYPVDGGGRWQLLGDITGADIEKITETQKTAYKTQGVVAIVRQLRNTSAFISSSRTGGSLGDDYDNIPNGRVIDKAIDLVYKSMIPFISGPVYANPETGQIAPETIETYQKTCYNAIQNNMILGKKSDNVELSVDIATGALSLDSVYINPNQNVLGTGQIGIEVRLVPVGTSDEIVINIGLVAELN